MTRHHQIFSLSIMKHYILRVLFLFCALSFSSLVWSHDLKGEWSLKIENLHRQPIATLDLRFTKEKASSCLSGDWLRVIVLSSTTRDKNFFPVSDLLSYSIEKNQLTIGRTDICDRYRMLNGTLKRKIIRGDYYSLGLGGASPLGYFSLSKKN